MENEFDSAQLSRIYVNRGQYSKERRYTECYVINKKYVGVDAHISNATQIGKQTRGPRFMKITL